MALLDLLIVLQCSLALLMALHDWVHLPPLTDIHALAAKHSIKERVLTTLINTGLVLFPLILCIRFRPGPLPTWALASVFAVYALLTIGTIAAWWVPYIFGSSAKHKQGFIEYRDTHTFLPAHGDNVVPNTLHVILHLHAWICLLLIIWLAF